MHETQTIKDLISHHPSILQITDKIKDAVELFFNKRIHSIVIQDQDSYSVLTLSALLDFVIEDDGENKLIASVPRKKLLTLDIDAKVTDAVFLLEKSADIIGVTESGGALCGVLTLTDLVGNIEQSDVNILADITIESILIQESTNSVHVGEKLKDKIQQLKNTSTDCIVILDGTKAKGIITKRDILRLSQKYKSLDENIETYMSAPLVAININSSVVAALEVMQTKHFRRAVVEDNNGNFKGIISQKSLIEYIYSHMSKKYSQDIAQMNDLLIVAVKERTAELEEYKDQLEVLVEKRTEALQMSNEKLLLEIEKRQETEEELKKSEEELKRLNDELSKRIKIEIEMSRKKDLTIFNQSKMAAMGELISMIAHQWRQPLTDLSLQMSHVKVKMGLNKLDNNFLHTRLSEMSGIVQHMSRTIDDFRNFFAPDKKKEAVCLEEIVESSLELLERGLHTDGIEVETSFTELIPINTYKNELLQVCLNIIKNGWDILVENRVSNPKITISTVDVDKQHCAIIIKDNGGGIPEVLLHKIFDPYFTTKDEHNGTGLGLYMSKLIIEDHCHGRISVQNDDEGAVFTLTFAKGKA